MPTITRQQIKQVENGMRWRMGIDPSTLQGLGSIGHLGFFDPVSISLLTKGALGSGSMSFQNVIDWLLGKTGQLKITATQFAESMVKVMYGLDPDCRMPQPGIAIVPGNPTPRFCSGSIAGMIERCRLSDAQNTLDGVKQQFQEKTRKTGTGAYQYEEGQYVERWQNEYGNNDFSNLSIKITAARATCGIGGGPTITPSPIPGPGGSLTCPVNWRFNAEMNRCDYVLPGIQTGISSTTMLMIAAVGVALIFAMKR